MTTTPASRNASAYPGSPSSRVPEKPCRTGWLCRSDYEFGQHRALGTRAGLTDDEIGGSSRRTSAEGWPKRERTLLLVTDQLVAEHRLGDALWTALSADWSLQQRMDIVFTVGQYVLVSTARTHSRYRWMRD